MDAHLIFGSESKLDALVSFVVLCGNTTRQKFEILSKKGFAAFHRELNEWDSMIYHDAVTGSIIKKSHKTRTLVEDGLGEKGGCWIEIGRCFHMSHLRDYSLNLLRQYGIEDYGPCYVPGIKPWTISETRKRDLAQENGGEGALYTAFRAIKEELAEVLDPSVIENLSIRQFVELAASGSVPKLRDSGVYHGIKSLDYSTNVQWRPDTRLPDEFVIRNDAGVDVTVKYIKYSDMPPEFASRLLDSRIPYDAHLQQ